MPKKIAYADLDFLNLQLAEMPTIKQSLANLIESISQARKTRETKHSSTSSYEESEPVLQYKLHESLELDRTNSKVNDKEFVNLLQPDDHHNTNPLAELPRESAVYEDKPTKVVSQPPVQDLSTESEQKSNANLKPGLDEQEVTLENTNVKSDSEQKFINALTKDIEPRTDNASTLSENQTVTVMHIAESECLEAKSTIPPDFLLCMFSFFDVVPLLALVVSIIGWAYLGARLSNEGERLTNQRYSFFSANECKEYKEEGLDYNFKA